MRVVYTVDISDGEVAVALCKLSVYERIDSNQGSTKRLSLADLGRGEHSDLSRFVEDAVRARLMDLGALQAKAANTDISEGDLTAMVAKAIQWSRQG